MNKNKFNYYYDQGADVLYVSKGKPSKTDISEEAGDNVIMRFDRKTGKAKGFTIINFAKRSKKSSESVSLPFEINFGL